MIFTPEQAIYVYNDYIDMRKGHNSLILVITEMMQSEPLNGALYVFVAKNRKACKAIYFDGTGLILIHKKLEQGRFMSFNHIENVVSISSCDLMLILHGAHLPISKNGKKIRLKK